MEALGTLLSRPSPVPRPRPPLPTQCQPSTLCVHKASSGDLLCSTLAMSDTRACCRLGGANLTPPPPPRLRVQQVRVATGGTFPEHSLPRWMQLLPLSQGHWLQIPRSHAESRFHIHRQKEKKKFIKSSSLRLSEKHLSTSKA